MKGPRKRVTTGGPRRRPTAGPTKRTPAPPKKKEREWKPRNLGLLFGSMRVEVEDVKTSHKKVCDACGQLPEHRRLVVKKGSGRATTQEVYCKGHARIFLSCLKMEVQRAERRIAGEDIVVRIDPKIYPKERVSGDA